MSFHGRTGRAVVALAAATTLGTASLHAQQSVPHAVPTPSPTATQELRADPFDDIVAEALRANRTVAGARLGALRADAGVREARARFFPSLTIDARRSRQNGVLNLGDAINPANAALNSLLGQDRFPTNLSIVVPYAYESRARVAQPLFDPAISAAYRAALALGDVGSLETRVVARRIAAQAQEGWLDAALAKRGRMVWESALALVTENERVASRLVAAGRATPDVVFRARADRADVEQRLAEARDDEGAAARAFNQLLRRPLDAPMEEIAEAALQLPLPTSEGDAITAALANREEVRQTAAAVRAAHEGSRAANASFLPRISAAVDYGFQGTGVTFDRARDFLVGSVVLSWDVFNGGRDVARRQESSADEERARLREDETRELVTLDVRQAYRSAVVALAAIPTAEARLAAARSSHALVSRRFAEGLASQVELLDARNTVTDAELNRVRTIYRYARRAVGLERAAATRSMNMNQDTTR